MNNVSLIGNLATDVEVRDVSEDKKMASFLLAVNRGGRDAGADFVGVRVWERQAELCAEYLSKGQRVGVAGRLRSHSWEEDGKRRTVVEVIAQRVDFLSGPRGESPRSEGSIEDDVAVAEVIPFEAAAAG
jgi:single-strand DNA-binding protein